MTSGGKTSKPHFVRTINLIQVVKAIQHRKRPVFIRLSSLKRESTRNGKKTEKCLNQTAQTNHASYILTPWSRVLFEKLTGSAASQEIPRIFEIRRFITILTSARHLSLSWGNSFQSPQLPLTSWRSILILSSHLCLGLPSGLFPSGFPTRTLCTPLPSPICATCPAHLILLDFTTRTIFGKEYRPLSSSLCNFLHSSVT